jgi:hypothetical protein
MHFNRRMNGLEYPFEGAAAISLRLSQFLQMVAPSAFPHHNLSNILSAGGR